MDCRGQHVASEHTASRNSVEEKRLFLQNLTGHNMISAFIENIET